MVMFLRIPAIVHPTIDGSYLSSIFNVFLVFNACWLMVGFINGDSNYFQNYNFSRRLSYLLRNTLLFIGLAATITILLKLDYLNRTIFLIPIFLYSGLSLLTFSFLSDLLKQEVQLYQGIDVLVIGATNSEQRLLSFSSFFKKLGCASVNFVCDHKRSQHTDNKQVLGKIKDLPNVLDHKNVDEIFISYTDLQKEQVSQIIEIADFRGIRVSLIPEPAAQDQATLKPTYLEGIPVFQHRQTPLDFFKNAFIKKVFDFLFASAVLILLSPIYLLIALAILIDSKFKGPIFYTPERKGEKGKVFKCYKFRSMSECDSAANGTKSTIKDDPRITRVGKYLRKYDLDELPQFLNVLLGDMSIVGPRPHRVNLQKDFRKIVNDYMVRHVVKPGITGWAQVNGWRGPTVTNEQKKERIKHDLWYIENWSFLLDIKIVFLTVFSKKTRKNAF